MTEAQWLTCDEPSDMLAFVANDLSPRKELMFVLACSRKIQLLPELEGKAQMELLERYAEGQVGREELESLAPVLGFLVRRLPGLASDYTQDWAVSAGEGRYATNVLRDLFNPFHPVAFDAQWLTWNEGRIAHLAQAAYQTRCDDESIDRDRLLVLADAFEEAGCTDFNILDHLRGPGPHVRGCWALDMILGKG
jgi:hypothetical protein